MSAIATTDLFLSSPFNPFDPFVALSRISGAGLSKYSGAGDLHVESSGEGRVTS
jgi:hypothetical protein